MKEKYTFEYLAAYLDQGLNADEQAELEKDLQTDKELQDELARHRQTRQLVEQLAIAQTHDTVGRIFKDHQSRSVKGGGRRSLLRIAAAVVLILSLAGGFWLSQAATAPGALADTYLEPFPDRLTTMGGSQEDALATAMRAYNAGDFATALPALQALPEEHPQYDLIALYTGVAALEAGYFTVAQNKLQLVQEQSENYREVANWYLALSYLKDESVEAARPLLQALVDAGGYQASAAKALLEELE